MTRQTLITLALGACTLGLVAACKDKAGEPVATEAPGVQVATIISQKVEDKHEWFGYLQGKDSTDIHPRVSGFLLSQEYANGSTVKEGDVLFRIDPAPFEAVLAQAKANLQAAEATLSSAEASRDQAKLDVARFTPLAEAHAVSEKDLSDARHKLAAAEASVKAALATIEQQKAAVQDAQINLDFCTIRAPYDGIAGTALSSIGDLVTPSTKMTNITSVKPIKVRFAINSISFIEAFRKYGTPDNAEPAKYPMPSFEIRLEDGSIYPFKGKVTTMGSTVSENGMLDIEGVIDNPDSILRAGMPVRVLIPSSEQEVLLVPPSAVRTVLRNDFVIVVDKDNVPHTIPVTVKGEYKVMADGKPKTLVAIGDYKEPLADVLKGFGYSSPTEARVVADSVNGVRAQNISAANSRLGKDDPTPRGTISPLPYEEGSAIPEALKELAAQATSGEKKAPDTQAKPVFPLVPVKVTPLLQQDVEGNNEWFGSLRGEQETDIRPQVSGFLLKTNFDNGTLVKKGDILYEIDPSTYQAALDEARANLQAAMATKDKALAELDMHKADYERYERLRAVNVGTISDKTITDTKTSIDTATADVRKAEATIAQMKAAVQTAEINLGYTIIRAPFDGRVGISNPSIGALVGPGDPEPMVKLSSVNPMRVDFQVSGKGALRGIAAFGEKASKGDMPDAPEFEVILEDGSLYSKKGHIVSIDNSLNKSTGTLQVVGSVENIGNGLRSGMPVRVRSGIDPTKGAYLVPARAPLNAQGLDLIVLLGQDDAPEMLPITKGKLVNIPVTGPDGQAVVQPMQIIDVDRKVAGALVRAVAKAPSLEAVVLGQAQVKDWGELLLQKTETGDFRALLEKRAGSALPDDAPAKAGVKDWGELLLKKSGADDFRDLVLKEANAKDELDLIAQSQGCKDAMQMTLKQMGMDSLDKVRVVAEGSLMAAQLYDANRKANTRVNKAAPVPFQYKRPKTVEGSVTAEKKAN